MIDAVTQQRVEIYEDGSEHSFAPPYLMVPEEQAEQVMAALREHDVFFWQGTVVAIDDDPPVAIINLGRGADVRHVQQILDSL